MARIKKNGRRKKGKEKKLNDFPLCNRWLDPANSNKVEISKQSTAISSPARLGVPTSQQTRSNAI